MTNDFKDRFKMLRDTIALTADERHTMRSALQTLSSSAPIEAPMMRPLPTPFIFTIAPWQRMSFAFAALVIVVFGGTAVAAEGALPGEGLYAIKTGVNERFERAVTVGTVAKAEVDVRHAEERIREVELLAAKGANDPRAASEIALLVDEHIALASEAAETLSDEGNDAGADRISARIDSALSAHAEILEAQAENESDEDRMRLRALSVALSVTAEERIPEEEATKARTGEYYESVVRSRQEEAKRSLAALTDALRNNGVPEETIAALSEEQVSLDAEFVAAEALVADSDYRDAAEEYERLGKRAYRANALLTSAKRIGKETDMEVVVALDASEEAAVEAVLEAPAPSEALLFTGPVEDTAVRMKSAPTENAETSPLRFLIRERSR